MSFIAKVDLGDYQTLQLVASPERLRSEADLQLPGLPDTLPATVNVQLFLGPLMQGLQLTLEQARKVHASLGEAIARAEVPL